MIFPTQPEPIKPIQAKISKQDSMIFDTERLRMYALTQPGLLRVVRLATTPEQRDSIHQRIQYLFQKDQRSFLILKVMLDKAASDGMMSPQDQNLMLLAIFDRGGMGKAAYAQLMKSPEDGILKRRRRYYKQAVAMIDDAFLLQEMDKYRTTKLSTSPKPIPVKPGTNKPTPKPAPRKPSK
jgi:hypothetical protein